MAGSPFPDKLRFFVESRGDHRRHHGWLAFPREVTVDIMAGYPLLVELEDVEGSPSPSWPVPLPGELLVDPIKEMYLYALLKL